MRMSQINIEKAGLMIEAKKQNKDPIALGVDFLVRIVMDIAMAHVNCHSDLLISASDLSFI